MGAMIEQVVRDGSLLRFSIEGAPSCRKVVAFFSTYQDAEYCVQHFSGREWDRTGMPVCAEIRTDRSAVRSRSPVKVAMPQLSEQCLKIDTAYPAFIDSVACVRKVATASASSDASTEIGESETEDELNV